MTEDQEEAERLRARLEEVVGQPQQLGAEQDRVRKDNQAKTRSSQIGSKSSISAW